MSESTESTPPIAVSRLKFAAPLHLIIAFAISVAGAAIAWGELKDASRHQGNRLQDLEDRMVRMEQFQSSIAQDVANTKTNVEWMRRWMEGRYANTPTPPRP